MIHPGAKQDDADFFPNIALKTYPSKLPIQGREGTIDSMMQGKDRLGSQEPLAGGAEKREMPGL